MNFHNSKYTFVTRIDHLLLLIHKHLLSRQQVPDTLLGIVGQPFPFSLLEGHASVPLSIPYLLLRTGRGEDNPTDHPWTFYCEQCYSGWFSWPIPAG